MDTQNICIITFPIAKAGNIPLSNLVEIVYSLSDNVYVITGNDGYKLFKEDKRFHTYGIKHKSSKNIIKRIVAYVYVQIRIAHLSLKLRKKTKLYVFFIGGGSLVLPMMFLKLFGKD